MGGWLYLFFSSERFCDDIRPPLCLHQFCGAPQAVCHGWFLHTEFTACASHSPPASTQSGALEEAVWRRATWKYKLMRQRKGSRKTEENESCDRAFNLQKACANSLVCFFRKLVAWTSQKESASKFDKCKVVLVNLVSGTRGNAVSIGFEYLDPFSPLWYPFGTVFKRTVFSPQNFYQYFFQTVPKFLPFMFPTFSLLFKNNLLFEQERLFFSLT